MQISIDPVRVARPQSAPLQIYLDSNDYSNLSKAMGSKAHPDRPIFDGLCDLVDQNLIEIRFSAVHIVEMTHLDARSKPAALQRARCLQRLTRGRCFRYWIDTEALECREFLAGTPSFSVIANDRSEWHPDFL